MGQGVCFCKIWSWYINGKIVYITMICIHTLMFRSCSTIDTNADDLYHVMYITLLQGKMYSPKGSHFIILLRADGPTLKQHWVNGLCRIINPLATNLFNWNFHPLEVVSRWRDPQLQVSENYSDLTKWRSTNFKFCWLLSLFIFNLFKRLYVKC